MVEASAQLSARLVSFPYCHPFPPLPRGRSVLAALLSDRFSLRNAVCCFNTQPPDLSFLGSATPPRFLAPPLSVLFAAARIPCPTAHQHPRRQCQRGRCPRSRISLLHLWDMHTVTAGVAVTVTIDLLTGRNRHLPSRKDIPMPAAHHNRSRPAL